MLLSPLRTVWMFSAAIGLMHSAGIAHAAPGDSIGSAVTVVSLVTANLAQEERRLSVGDDVHQQELIEVDLNGRSELLLRDTTKVALGPGARLLLDTFVYDPDISGGAIVLNLLHGAFRFLTGVAAKPAYVIRTPNASITVRGTIFDVFVDSNNVTWVLLLEGAVEACANNGACRVLDEPGKLVRIGPDAVDRPSRWATLARPNATFGDAFPFVFSPPRIAPDPILTLTDIVGVAIPARPSPIRAPSGRQVDAGRGASVPYGQRPKPVPIYEGQVHRDVPHYKWRPLLRRHWIHHYKWKRHRWQRHYKHHYGKHHYDRQHYGKRHYGRRWAKRIVRYGLGKWAHRPRY